MTANMSHLQNTGNCPKYCATDTRATVVTREMMYTDSRKCAPMLTKKYSMQCMLQDGDEDIMHNKADAKPEVVVSHVLD